MKDFIVYPIPYAYQMGYGPQSKDTVDWLNIVLGDRPSFSHVDNTWCSWLKSDIHKWFKASGYAYELTDTDETGKFIPEYYCHFIKMPREIGLEFLARWGTYDSDLFR